MKRQCVSLIIAPTLWEIYWGRKHDPGFPHDRPDATASYINNRENSGANHRFDPTTASEVCGQQERLADCTDRVKG